MEKVISEYMASIGKKGGSVKSKKKAETAIENGKKGGRPSIYPPRKIKLLEKQDKISNFLQTAIIKMGFEIDNDGSNLSDSIYITIKNWEEITGQESQYNREELKIRISDHDLPPSYDGLHGYHDIDIMTNGKHRLGNDGGATYYDDVIEWIAKKASKPLPRHIVMLRKYQKYEQDEHNKYMAQLEAERQAKDEQKRASLTSDDPIDPTKVNSGDCGNMMYWAECENKDPKIKLLYEEMRKHKNHKSENYKRKRDYLLYLYFTEKGENDKINPKYQREPK